MGTRVGATGGCNSWFRALARQVHTQAFRERFRELIKDDAKKKLAEEKRKEYDRRWEDKMWRKIVRKDEKLLEGENKRRRRGDDESNRPGSSTDGMGIPTGMAGVE